MLKCILKIKEKCTFSSYANLYGYTCILFCHFYRERKEGRRGATIMNGWMTCNFTSFYTVFQSYHDDERLIMKCLCNGTPFTVKKISPPAGLELTTARSAGQLPLSYRGSWKLLGFPIWVSVWQTTIKKGPTLKGKNLLLYEQILSFNSRPLQKRATEKKIELFPLKMYPFT